MTTKINNTNPLEVVVGVIKRYHNSATQYFLAQRTAHKPLPFKWEFPGGKVERLETQFQALRRELKEEIGITIDQQSTRKVMEIPWLNYERQINLHIYEVSNYYGQITSAENQNIKWFNLSDIKPDTIPEANKGLLSSLKLPGQYAITGDFDHPNQFLSLLNSTLSHKVTLCQIRLDHKQWSTWGKEKSKEMVALAKKYNAKLLLNSNATNNNLSSSNLPLGFSGWHLNSKTLVECKSLSFVQNKLISGSVHNQTELNSANQLGLDFICLSPVLQANSDRSKSNVLGWNKASSLCKKAIMPVFYLGGLNKTHLPSIKAEGAHGIAAISYFWHYNNS